MWGFDDFSEFVSCFRVLQHSRIPAYSQHNFPNLREKYFFSARSHIEDIFVAIKTFQTSATKKSHNRKSRNAFATIMQ